MPDRTRVLWVAKGLGPGGMEQLLLNHATVGDRERFDYEAAYLVERPNSIVSRLEAAGVRCHHVGGDDPRDPRWVGRLRGLVRRRGIDVVHLHSPFVAALARPSLRAMRGGPPIVYTEHNSVDCYGRATRWGDLATYGLDHARFAVSADARDSVPQRLRRRTEVLIHGVDVEGVSAARLRRDAARTELGVGPDDRLIGIVANLRPAKAYPVLLHAARRVVDADPRVRFVSLGQGPLAAELDRLHGELELGDRFRFLGFTADAVGTMSAFDVFVLSSDVEGLPVAVMEAKALGLPIVATAVGGLPEAITDGEDGLLVPPRDPDRLAAALGRVLGDDELRARLGAASAADASRFDARAAVRRQEELYLRLVRSGPSPST